MMRKDELENASQEQQKINIEEKTKVIKRLIGTYFNSSLKIRQA